MTLDLTDPLQVCAGTCYGEARGLGIMGMSDVAHVIMNRVRLGRWGGIVGVCLAREQFSSWDDDDPNRAKIMAAAENDPHNWALAIAAAQGAMNEDTPDRTQGADSYYAVSIRAPYWAKAPAVHTVTLGLHSFWIVRRGSGPVPNVRAAAADEADALNAEELAKLAG